MARSKLTPEQTADDQEAILRILAGQTPGYLTAHDSAAFLSAGLNPDDVRIHLGLLQETGHVVHVVAETAGQDGEPVESDRGWAITDQGRAALPERT